MNGHGEIERSRFDVVVLVASAGGLGALITVLRDLPANLPAAVVVQQHLGAHGSALVWILTQQSGREVTWARDGGRLVAGRVLVCPPSTRMEVLPNGTCSLLTTKVAAHRLPHDALLVSCADAFGARGLAVVLTGMGHDGAAGAAAVKEAGGFVLVQSPDTAAYPSMPTAAAPAAHLLLPLAEIGPMIDGQTRAPNRSRG